MNFVGQLHAGPTLIAEAHRRAEGLPPARHPQGRARLVPGLLRAQRRLRPRQPPRARAERDGDDYVHQRPEDLDQLRPRRRVLRDARAHRPRGAQAQGHHLADRADGRRRASTSARCATMEGTAEFCEVFFDDVRVPGRQPRRRRERRLARRHGHAQLRARHRVRRPTCSRRWSSCATSPSSPSTITSNGATALGGRRPAPRPRPASPPSSTRCGRSPSATSRRRNAPVWSVSAAACSSSRSPSCASASATSPCTCSTARRSSLDDVGDLPTGRHVHGRFYALSMTIAAGTSQVQRNIVAERVLGLPEGSLSAMDFELTDDQVALQEGVRAFLDGRFPLDVVRAIEDAGAPRPRPVAASWARPACSRSRLPEADGGLGLGVSEAVLVFEELGRALVPGPLVATLPRRAAGSTAPPTGETIVGRFEPADAGVGGRAPRRPRRAARARRRRRPPASTPTAIASTAVERPLDALHAAARSSPATCPTASVIADAAAAERVRASWASCSPARCSSASPARAVELATEYAKEREQFGRPIGSFQAVKHLCADMLVRAEVARAAVYAAACALDGRSDDDPVRAAPSAKILAGDAAHRQRQGVHPGARRDRVHVGGRRAALLEARRACSTPTSATATSTPRPSPRCSDTIGQGDRPWGSATGVWSS